MCPRGERYEHYTMSVVNDCSQFIQSNERTLATSKTIAYFRPGEVYALRGRANGNPCGNFGPCWYLSVLAVPCNPCLVELIITDDFESAQQPSQVASTREIRLTYDNRTGQHYVETLSEGAWGTPVELATLVGVFKAARGRLTAIGTDAYNFFATVYAEATALVNPFAASSEGEYC